MKKIKKASRIICLLLLIMLLFSAFSSCFAKYEPAYYTINITQLVEPVAGEKPQYTYRPLVHYCDPNPDYGFEEDCYISSIFNVFDLTAWIETDMPYTDVVSFLDNFSLEDLNEDILEEFENVIKRYSTNPKYPEEETDELPEIDTFLPGMTYIAIFSGQGLYGFRRGFKINL